MYTNLISINMFRPMGCRYTNKVKAVVFYVSEIGSRNVFAVYLN
ncbi:MAG: hypothetical protein ACPGLV_06030 [Bacteroidia bacterium]